MRSFKVKCLQGCRDVYLLHISPMKIFNIVLMRTSKQKNVDNLQRNAHSSHLVFQNEANFSPREAYLPMKIFCKFGKASWCWPTDVPTCPNFIKSLQQETILSSHLYAPFIVLYLFYFGCLYIVKCRNALKTIR